MTIRQVAAEAEVSARLLQHYFGDRHGLLVGALALLNTDAEAAAAARIQASGADGPRSLIRALLHELLPLDEDRRVLHTIYAAYFVQLLTDPALREIADPGEGVAEVIEDILSQARQAGLLLAASRVDLESATLVAVAEGLQAQLLLGHTSPGRAIALIDHALDRLFLMTSPDEPPGENRERLD